MGKMGFNDLTAKILDHSKNAFGETVEYRPKGGSPKEITAIFDETFLDVDVNGEVMTQSSVPVLGLKVIDLVDEPADGDEVLIREKEFRVISIQKDGRGGATLVLHKL